MTARLVVCSTCRFSEAEPVDLDGRSGGQALLNAVTAILDAECGELRVEEQACLWACASHCAVYMAEEGKPAYLAGQFAPTTASAEAIVAFARLYAANPDGAVPYKQWPEGMKGHFIARLPNGD